MKRILSRVLALVLLLALGTGLYVNDYYHAQEDARVIYESARHSGSRTLFRPEKATDTGLIFYPGGKVEPSAYAPLLQRLSENGILCVLQEMPGNLAVLNPNAAADIFDSYPEITHWYIAGHSLGGSMGASFAGKHPERLEGVIFLAAYSTKDLSSTRVLSIYGTEDGVLNREKYEKNRKNLPEDTTEIILEGGNHASFGSYGEQKGDGQALISQAQQQAQTVQAILKFIRGTMDRVILGYRQTDYSADDYGTVTYQAPDDSPISEEAYMNPPQLSGMPRSAAQIGWLTYFHSSELTKEDLASSWGVFQRG